MFTSEVQIFLISLGVSIAGFLLYLQFTKRRKFEHAVREETGERHAQKKNIPDLAGIVMLILYAVLVPVFNNPAGFTPEMTAIYITPLLFGLLGLVDDLVKSRFKNTKGIPARFRFAFQIIFTIAVIYFLKLHHSPYGILYGIWILLFIPATVNAANFTDGLDGLLGGIALVILFGMLMTIRNISVSQSMCHLLLPEFRTGIIFIPIIIVFLQFNFNPAKMFMGDGGSMFIGSYLAMVAISSDLTFAMLVIGFVIYAELLSVVMQVVSYRTTGKRIFPMTPIHHSFEKWGWKETRIVNTFYIVSIMFAALGTVIWSYVF